MDRFDGLTQKEGMSDAYDDILSFEKQLSDDGTVILKFFLYIDQKEQKKRFEKLEDSRETAWQVTKGDWRRNREFDRYLRINEEMLERTDTDYAPWVIVEAVDRDFAAAKIAESVADRLEAAVSDLQNNRVEQEDRGDLSGYRRWDQSGVLSGIDLSKTISQEEYKCV